MTDSLLYLTNDDEQSNGVQTVSTIEPKHSVLQNLSPFFIVCSYYVLPHLPDLSQIIDMLAAE